MGLFLSRVDANNTDVMPGRMHFPAMRAARAVAFRAPEFDLVGVQLAAVQALLFAA
jgi:hypothetical protein